MTNLESLVFRAGPELLEASSAVDSAPVRTAGC